jgi:hypothetical protein
MSRAVVAGVALLAIALAGCSGRGSALRPFERAPACALLAQLAVTGQNVAHADVSDPSAFEATLHSAVSSYVRTAQRLHAVVPARLQPDVQQMIAAAQRNHFSDAAHARAEIDTYARSTCKSI